MPQTACAAMSPGSYVRLRREAAGLSIDELALMTETVPHVCARTRAEYLRDIEAGTMKLGKGVTLELAAAGTRFPFVPGVLARLVAIEQGEPIVAPHLCRRCGCSWFAPCNDTAGNACAWSAEDSDLCTACIVADAEASFAA